MNIAILDNPESQAAYLRTLPAIRERCGRVHELAKEGKLQYFDYHPEKEGDVADFCVEIMKRDYGSDFSSIKPHGRWRHLDAGVGRVLSVIAGFHARPNPPDHKEEIRRIIDLFVVSVLLDAGAGNKWVFYEKSSGMRFTRSEGLGVASIHMFEEGLFSSDPHQPSRVDAAGLAEITVEKMAAALQVTDLNPMVGLEGRTSLLTNLSKALKNNPQLFGDDGRPGNMVDFLESESKMEGETRVVPLAAIWHCLIEGLNPIWPSRIHLGGVSLGDVWPCSALKSESTQLGDDLVPFHKLTMWITYSLIEVFQRVANWRVDGLEDLTGLPEYRNGGLLVDHGVLALKPNALPIDPASGLPSVPPSSPAIVEWRAMTVIELDRLAAAIRKKLSLTSEQLTLAQVLEGATWKGGREIAKQKRPETGGPPIEIESDGTVF
ncbi:DUF1688-domain-containing protein [Tricholoma matsutake]|nr:DUF1688-domain-containing protein [Tricholoma matsutake 945]